MTVTPDNVVNDTLLLDHARNGDQLAYHALYQAHHSRIYALCLRLLGDRELAEDALQDSFIQAWRKLSEFRNQAAFGSWLHRIAVNQCLGMHRKSRPWLVFSNTAQADTGRRTSEKEDIHIDLEWAISRLPQRPRQVLVLHDIEGYTHAEVADALNIAAGTSKAQLHRARKQLKEWLNDA